MPAVVAKGVGLGVHVGVAGVVTPSGAGPSGGRGRPPLSGAACGRWCSACGRRGAPGARQRIRDCPLRGAAARVMGHCRWEWLLRGRPLGLVSHGLPPFYKVTFQILSLPLLGVCRTAPR